MNREARNLLAGALGCAALFALAVAAAYGVNKVERLDARTLRSLWVGGDNGDALWPHVIAHISDPVPLLFFLAAVAGLGLYFGRGPQVVAGIGVVVFANVTSQVLKVVLAHKRIEPLWLDMEDASLPSGHATAAMSLAVAAVIIAPRSLRVPAAVAGVLFAIAVGISVVLLGWHYPSDVFAGYLVAVGVGLLALTVLCLRDSEGEREPLGAEVSRTGEGALPAAALGLAAFASVVIAISAARADDLLRYARDHTPGTAIALAIAAGAVVLMTLFTLAARESEAVGGRRLRG